MGLPAEIYRGNYDSAANVFHGKHEVTLVNVDGPFEPTEERPPAMLVEGHLAGTVRVVAAESVESESAVTAYKPLKPSDAAGPMMGGTYVATSDGRFEEAVEKLIGQRFYGAVPLHDRFESAQVAGSMD